MLSLILTFAVSVFHFCRLIDCPHCHWSSTPVFRLCNDWSPELITVLGGGEKGLTSCRILTTDVTTAARNIIHDTASQSQIVMSSAISHGHVTVYAQNVDNSSVSSVLNSTVTQTSSKCLMLQFGDFVPWDNPESVVDAQTEALVRRVKETMVLPVLCLIGGPANVINMAVFAKQGLKERINVCLFALSLADFLYLVSNMVLYGEQIHLQFTTKERYMSNQSVCVDTCIFSVSCVNFTLSKPYRLAGR